MSADRHDDTDDATPQHRGEHDTGRPPGRAHEHTHSHKPRNDRDQGDDQGHDQGDDQGHDHEHRPGFWSRLLEVVRPHAHDVNESIQTAEDASADGIRAAWVSLAGMAATAAGQIVIVAVSGSVGLLADTLHNAGHAVTTIPLVLAFRLGRRPPGRRYTYGYRRAEDLTGILIAVVIALSAAVIIWESVSALVNPHPLTNLGWVVAAGVVGAAGNELVALYRIRVGRRIGSVALIAEGNHARADGLTSLAVVAGAAGVWLGFPRADAVVGLLIAVAILWILVSSSRQVLRRLMDGVDEGTVESIEAIAAVVPDVRSVDRVRARWTGHRLEAEVDVGVDGGLSVERGHAIAEQVHHQLLHGMRHLRHVAVHVNPVTDGRTLDEAHHLTAHHTGTPAHATHLAADHP